MTFEEWLSEAAKYAVRNNKEQRRGQAYFNHLDGHRKDISFNIVGTRLDPLYYISRLYDFLEYVKKYW